LLPSDGNKVLFYKTSFFGQKGGKVENMAFTPFEIDPPKGGNIYSQTYALENKGGASYCHL